MIIEIKTRGPVFDGRFNGIMDKEYRGAMTDSIYKLENEIAKNTPVGVTGILRAGIQGRVVSPYRGRVGVVGAAAKYGDIRERGRRPGPVSREGQESIALWVKRKLQIRNEKELKSVAYLVTRKIRKKGYKGAFMFKNAEKKLRGWVIRRFEIATKRLETQVTDR